MKNIYTLSLAFLLGSSSLFAQKTNTSNKNGEKKKEPIFESSSYGNLKFRNIGPALTSGRIADIAVSEKNPSYYFVAAASGGVWKTVNAGTTYEPIFDKEGSYSIGCLAIDPKNDQTVWVGTGENNNQRSVAYGDGIYKSLDGGNSWTNMGLKNSEHIGKIIIHPENSDIVYVAVYGPLWKEGGERGIYKTIDGGKNWERIFNVSDETGFNEIHFDPQDPNTLYATAHQRRRHVFIYISGGPESCIYKSKDAGKTWYKINKGLPGDDLGRIGLAVSPANPQIVYAVVEGTGKNGGFYRSTNKGENFARMNDFYSAGNYYQEIIADPIDPNTVYFMDTYAKVTNDGGATIKNLGEKSKHVDNHALWINPSNNKHLLIGCDGGLYESWDTGKNWQYKPHLPITQFYKLALDNQAPFYNVYGGTQDNFTLGGPARTKSKNGIVNSDWFVTLGGDGFEPQVDPTNPNIVYSQYQYGNLHRFDKKSGEIQFIKPIEDLDEDPLRWNWDAPLLISPHNASTLYFAANKVFKSIDKGNSWQAVSGDLTQKLNRDELKVMGRTWSVDAVAKGQSTSFYGNITALDESPLKKGLLYAGIDDGLIQVSQDDGKNWKKIASFPGIPENTYVNFIKTSQHKEGRVFAVFNNHKRGDFKPYLMKSEDFGNTWVNVSGNLPERGSVYSFAEDHVNENLWFTGTEFGVFFTFDAGKNFIQLKGNLPVIAVRDMEIQKQCNDLVIATFGRGFYVLDNYSSLRNLSADVQNQTFKIFETKPGEAYLETEPLGGDGKSFQGEMYFLGDNLGPHVFFDFWMKETPKSIKKKRQDIEKEQLKNNQSIKTPSAEMLRAEDFENEYALFLTIKNDQGEEVKRIKTKFSEGLNRVKWDLRLPSSNPVQLQFKEDQGDKSQLTLPGNYTLSAHLYVQDSIIKLTENHPFTVKLIHESTLPASDVKALYAFQQKTGELNKKFKSAGKKLENNENKLKFIRASVEQYGMLSPEMLKQIDVLEKQIQDSKIQFYGDNVMAKREYPTRLSLSQRISNVLYSVNYSYIAATETQKKEIEQTAKRLKTEKEKIDDQEKSIEKLLNLLNEKNIPYTPGR